MELQELIDILIEIRDNYNKRQMKYGRDDRMKGEELMVYLSNNCNEPQRTTIRAFESLHPSTYEDFVSIHFMNNKKVNWVPILGEVK